MTSSSSMSLRPFLKSSSMFSICVPAFLKWELHQAVKVCDRQRESYERKLHLLRTTLLSSDITLHARQGQTQTPVRLDLWPRSDCCCWWRGSAVTLCHTELTQDQTHWGFRGKFHTKPEINSLWFANMSCEFYTKHKNKAQIYSIRLMMLCRVFWQYKLWHQVSIKISQFYDSSFVLHRDKSPTHRNMKAAENGLRSVFQRYTSAIFLYIIWNLTAPFELRPNATVTSVVFRVCIWCGHWQKARVCTFPARYCGLRGRGGWGGCVGAEAEWSEYLTPDEGVGERGHSSRHGEISNCACVCVSIAASPGGFIVWCALDASVRIHPAPFQTKAQQSLLLFTVTSSFVVKYVQTYPVYKEKLTLSVKTVSEWQFLRKPEHWGWMWTVVVLDE